MTLSVPLMQPAQQGGESSPFSFLIPMALIFAVFYFLVIAPQRKRQKKQQEMIDNIKNGDRIVTSGGILGTVVRANQGEDSVRIRIAPSVEIDITRTAITGLQSDPTQGS